VVRNKAVLANAGVRGFAAILAFASQIVMVKLLGENAYGSYVLFVTYCSLIFIFSRSGLDVVALRASSVAYGHQDRAQFGQVFRRVLTLGVLLSIVWALLFSLAKQLSAFKRFAQSDAGVGWVLAGVLGMTLLAVLLGVVRGTRRIISADVVDSIAKPLVIMLVIWILVGYGSHGNSVGYIAFIAANLIATIATAALLIGVDRKSRWREAPGGSRLELLSPRSAATYITYGLITYVFFQLDTLIVGMWLGTAEVGAYNMACNFVRLVIFVPMIVVIQMQPSIASAFHSKDFRTIRATVAGAMKKSLFFAGGGVLALVLFGRWLLGLVSESFAGAYPTLLVLAFAHLMNSAILVLTGMLLMCKEQKLVVMAQFAGLCVCAPLYFVLIPRIGTIGAATSVLLGLVVNLACLTWLSARWISKDKIA